ncbi:MAG: 1,4-alpha-glucan branching enzyme, partial [Erysipelotrichaceae bacterium]|nr:1,4-alpha-glucan branching enzyme [Erysipelotrichaceae bacterium]
MDNKELQSFYDGYSLHAYNVFGAHFTENGVCFRLYAPNARSVRLVGDFNNWNSDATHLKKINKEVWEVTVPNLPEYAQYKYVIEQADGKFVTKTDPYAFYNEMRPGWVCKVVNIDEYKWTDREWVKNRNND